MVLPQLLCDQPRLSKLDTPQCGVFILTHHGSPSAAKGRSEGEVSERREGGREEGEGERGGRGRERREGERGVGKGRDRKGGKEEGGGESRREGEV